MVVQAKESFVDLYGQIKRNALSKSFAGSSTVMILCHPDVDSLCSLRILVEILKSDSIAFEICPVSTVTDLKNAADAISQAKSLYTIISLNVGGLVDLESFFELPSTATLYLMDSHRPLNLRNLFGSTQIVAIDDGSISTELKELRMSYEAVEFDSETDEDSDDSEEDSEAEEELQNSEIKDVASVTSDQDQHPDDRTEVPSDDEGLADVSDSPKSAKRKPSSPESLVESQKKKSVALQRKTIKRNHRENISSYYSDGAAYGFPITNLLYGFASLMGRANQDFLWYSILSSTSNFIYGKLDALGYTTFTKESKDEVDRLTLSNDETDEDNGANPFEASSNSKQSLKTPEDKSIRYIKDFQLVLLRHWNLYDSLFHSTYVATKLGVWKEKGRQRLTNLLVKMALPQKEQKELYIEMNSQMKKSLFQRLSDLAPKYNMPDMIFPSFERNYGFVTTLSASDVVYSITALLDCGGTLLNQKGITGYEAILSAATESSTLLGSIREKHAFQDISSNGETGLVGSGFKTKTPAALIASTIMDKVALSTGDKRQDWIRHFYLAYDALKNPQLLQHGILLSIHYQRLVVQTAIGILERKTVQSLKYFQIAILKGSATSHISGDSETEIFGSSIPLLYRLTSFLMEAYQTYKERMLPFVMFAYNESTESYLVLGRGPNTKRNPFGIAFREAAQRTGIEINDDFFDSSCIAISLDDLDAFLDNLQLTLAVVASSSYEYMSRLKWYLPMSADPNLTLTRSANHLIIENENSIAGIKFEDGTYEYNTTFHEETACSACSGDKFYTLSKNGSFGIWNGENGSGLEWNKVIDGSVDYCKISFLSRHKYGFLVNNKQMIVTDLNGKIAWTWNDKEVARTWSEVLVGVDEVTLIGRNDTTICWIDIDVKYGNVSKKLCKNALIDSDIFITGENSDFAVWVAASGHIEGVYLPDGQYLNFPEARADMSEFNEAPKTIIKLDSPDLFRSVLVVNYGVGKEILLSVADEASNLAVAYIPVVDTGSQNLYLYRDANYEINTLGRIYADKSNSNVNVFELIDPLSGEIIQQTELEPVFSGRPIRGFLDTKMSEDGYFTWIVIGLDDAGGFFFHKPYYGEEHNPVRPAGDISEELAPEEHSEEL